MRCALQLHPDSRCDAVECIAVEISRTSERSLRLVYRLAGRLDGLRLPPRAPTERRDELWRQTCFEAFIGIGDAYLEYNFAPSSQWQAYRFASYRRGMAEADLPPPRLDIGCEGRSLDLDAQLEGLPPGPWKVALAAVVEEAEGRLSYWALAHSEGGPDFHHPDCFTLDLAAPDRP